jgi:hypothetical protein
MRLINPSVYSLRVLRFLQQMDRSGEMYFNSERVQRTAASELASALESSSKYEMMLLRSHSPATDYSTHGIL